MSYTAECGRRFQLQNLSKYWNCVSVSLTSELHKKQLTRNTCSTEDKTIAGENHSHGRAKKVQGGDRCFYEGLVTALAVLMKEVMPNTSGLP
jgi:hypothetical protein